MDYCGDHLWLVMFILGWFDWFAGMGVFPFRRPLEKKQKKYIARNRARGEIEKYGRRRRNRRKGSIQGYPQPY